MLSNIVSFKKNIIVTGSHGKTTTTSLIAKILLQAKLDPTIINGGVINSIKNNAKLGRGEWSVLEADESDGSFLKLPINYSIVTNIDQINKIYEETVSFLKKSTESKAITRIMSKKIIDVFFLKAEKTSKFPRIKIAYKKLTI